jgi:hypothetical protein
MSARAISNLEMQEPNQCGKKAAIDGRDRLRCADRCPGYQVQSGVREASEDHSGAREIQKKHSGAVGVPIGFEMPKESFRYTCGHSELVFLGSVQTTALRWRGFLPDVNASFNNWFVVR